MHKSWRLEMKGKSLSNECDRPRAIVPMTLQAETLRHFGASTLDVTTTNHVAKSRYVTMRWATVHPPGGRDHSAPDAHTHTNKCIHEDPCGYQCVSCSRFAERGGGGRRKPCTCIILVCIIVSQRKHLGNHRSKARPR